MILQVDNKSEAIFIARTLTTMCNDVRMAFIDDDIKAQSYEQFLCSLRDSIQVMEETQ